MEVSLKRKSRLERKESVSKDLLSHAKELPQQSIHNPHPYVPGWPEGFGNVQTGSKRESLLQEQRRKGCVRSKSVQVSVKG